ncbi:MAG: hypothetical protein KC586_07390 [Myxococcales bacterium]|nr:hypothetical protein [Myxococcales bacterium]
MIRATSFLSLTLLLGCDLAKFAAGSTADVFTEASPALDAHFDVTMIGDALPANVMQLEGLLRVVPDHEGALLGAMRGYGSYAYGYVEDEAERLEAAGDAEGASEQRRRALLLYRRATELAHHYAALRLDGFEEAREEGVPAFRAWLDDLDRDDAEDLFWVGFTWGQWINAAYPNERHADRDFALAMVRRSVALDPRVYGASGSGVLAFAATRAPGTTVEGAERAWRVALERSERKNLLLLVFMARTYAVRVRDRALYVALLREVLEAGDLDPEMRLSNLIAKRRAERYLREVARLFPN